MSKALAQSIVLATGSQTIEMRAFAARREPDVDDEPDYPKPPKGYMHPEDLRNIINPSAGLKPLLAE